MTQPQSQKQTWLNLGLIGVLLILVAISAYLWFPEIVEQDVPAISGATEPETAEGNSSTQDNSAVITTSEDTPTDRPASAVMDHLLIQARHIEGPADAPVTIIEFSDFK